MIAAIGAFDGFHRGHQALLRRASEIAKETGEPWGVITFTRHPDRFLGFEGFKSLFMLNEQRMLEQYFEIPIVHRLAFTPQLARMTPEEFLDYASNVFGVRGIVVGEDFRFGRDRAGTPDYLCRECTARHWAIEIIPIQITQEGVPVSSTVIRNAVMEGNLPYAWDLLTYPFFYRSSVQHGDGRGRKLGFPTANLTIDPEKISPRKGVYATLVLCDGAWYVGAANIGCNPTFTGIDDLRFEVNLLDYSGSLYDRELSVFLLRHIRDERRFDDVDELKRQVAQDTGQIGSIALRALQTYGDMWKHFAALESQPVVKPTPQPSL